MVRNFETEYFVLFSDGWLRSIGQHKNYEAALDYADDVEVDHDFHHVMVINGNEATQWVELINNFRPHDHKNEFDKNYFKETSVEIDLRPHEQRPSF